MAVLVNHDYESGQTLAALGYTQNPPAGEMVNQSGEGLSGSTWGVRGSPGDSATQKYGRLINITFTHSGRHFTVQGQFDHADAGHSRHGATAFALTRTFPTGGLAGTEGWFADLYHGVGDADPDRSKLQLYLQPVSLSLPVWESDAGIIVPTTTQTLKICGRIATRDVENEDFLGNAPVNSDGRISVYVDNVLLVTLDNVQVGAEWGNGWTGVSIGPMGRFDNLCIADVPCVPLSTRRNLLTGQDHTVTGSDNLIAGVGGALVGDRSVLFNLDGTPRSVTKTGAFVVYGNVEINGNASSSGGTIGRDISALFDGLGT